MVRFIKNNLRRGLWEWNINLIKTFITIIIIIITNFIIVIIATITVITFRIITAIVTGFSLNR